MLTATRRRRAARLVVGLGGLAVAGGFLLAVLDGDDLRAVGRAVTALLRDPLGLAAALTLYAVAFVLRAVAWRRTLPGLSRGQAWAALHVSLLGNHVLPLRLGELARATSVRRRTRLPLGPVAATALSLRGVDVLGVLGLAAVGVLAVGTGDELLGGDRMPLTWLVAAGLAALALGAAGTIWSGRLRSGGAAVRPVGPAAALLSLTAWVLEAAVVWEVARAAGVALTPAEAVGVTAATVAAQVFAVTPGGVGTYEAAGTAALVGLGVDPGPAFAVVLTTHAVKTAYALVTGAVALAAPAPAYWGRLRLPRRLPAPPAAPYPVDDRSPVVVMIPVHDEEATVGDVVARVPRTLGGRRVEVVVVDDGSTDASAARAAEGGATVVAHERNLGLGAAVRRGLAEAVVREPAAVVYLDADGEYAPEDVPAVVAPVLEGRADYVVGSRFAGEVRRMLRRRRAGNVLLTRWVRWLTRRRDISDGQSGMRAFSAAAAAAAEVVHDYNYAQVLTLDLLGKGFRYAEVPIRYAFRANGTSFVRPGTYLRRVVPAVHRELNPVD